MKKYLLTLILFTATSLQATEITVKYYPKTLLIYRRQEKPFINGPLMVARGKFYLSEKRNKKGKVLSISIIKELNTQKFYAKIYQVKEKAIRAKFPNSLNRELAIAKKYILKKNVQLITQTQNIIDKLKQFTTKYEEKITTRKKRQSWIDTIKGFNTPPGFKLPKEPKFIKLKIKRLNIANNPLMTNLKFNHKDYGNCIIGITEKIGTPVFAVTCFTEEYAAKEHPLKFQEFNYKNPNDIYLQYLSDGKPAKIYDPMANHYLKMMIILINTHKDRLKQPGSTVITKIPIF